MTEALLVRGGLLLTMDPAHGTLRADILTRDGVITEIRPGIEAPDDARIIEADGALVLPGFIDTHRHMWQAALRGMGADLTLGDYFPQVTGALAAQFTPDDVHLGETLSAYAALDAGVTTVQDLANIHDTPEHSDAALHALRTTGLRTVLAYSHSFNARHADRVAPDGLSRDAARLRSLLSDDQALVTMALEATARSEEGTLANWRLAAELSLPVALHVIGRFSEEPPLSMLQRLGLLVAQGERATYIHATDLDASQYALIRDSGGHLSIAPAVEMLMGQGYPPLLDALDAGLVPSLSADVEVTAPSDMFTQMRAALQAVRQAAHARARLDGSDPVMVTAEQVLSFATIEGARALGLDDRTGSLTVGKQADLIVLTTDRPGLRPVNDPAATVVLGADRGDIDTVIVAGRVLKEHGRLLDSGALPRLYAQADALRDRLTEPAR
ncbi:amidohydrolase [Streptomyces albireticuli]|uniref:Amidohydrolase n=1 Tax=Streptomyces albireticuli TaxID=1940 RepID=A0A1Z2LE18_9ACTN|nr:amidohydrolase family protein [Streptomyces albireticuli]ARZ72539.1 amidohydrolase [Streptomyces albireticuli]